MTNCLRLDLVKNLGNISCPELYYNCYQGTKVLIEKYHDEIMKCMDKIYEAPPQKLSHSEKLKFFTETRHSYGHTALLLSGGAALANYHFGVLKALHESDMMPKIVTGSSAGSLIAMVVCSRPYHKLGEMLNCYEMIYPKPILKTKNEVVDVWTMMDRVLKGQAIFCAETIKIFVKAHIGDMTFSELHAKFGWTLNITATYNRGGCTELRLLNYMTTPTMVIWSAIQASCAIPSLFDAVALQRKNGRGEIKPYLHQVATKRYQDGSLVSDLPMKRIAELFNVNTFIVSQTNPHVHPFIAVETGEIINNGRWRKRFLTGSKAMMGNFLTFGLNFVRILGLEPQSLKEISNVMR